MLNKNVKKKARQLYKEKRLLLTSDQVNEYSFKIYEQWLNSSWDRFTHYHIFLSIQSMKEVNTQYFINYLLNTHRQYLYCPAIEGKHLVHYKLDKHTQLKSNSKNILEPVNNEKLSKEEINKIECVFVPMIIGDTEGNRVGYGGGYYDKFLAEIPQAIKIGLCFFPPIDKIEDVSSDDVALNVLLTPDRIYKF